ncbi:MAG: 5-methyltetrahydropteroyltriglutamate--homocysteine S-methyltransferase [Chloroflexi bacterium]|nr:5-methyltetrahydropteroyltriglutamate--homocysteine S-methyltransferase [Chloroflexota bacterium]
MAASKTPYRADHVGSLLRPPEVLAAHAEHADGRISTERLREIEDRAILTVLDVQRQAGIDVLSDGEYRRSNWAGDFSAAVDGYVSATMPISFAWKFDADVENASEEELAASLAIMPQQAGRVIGARLKQLQRLTGHEAPFLKEQAGGAYKITMPAPSYVVARGYKPGITTEVYGSRAELMDEVAGIYRGEVQWLLGQGVPYIQLDNPHYPDYIEESRRQQWRDIGIDPAAAILEDIAGDNACLSGIDRSNVTIATHICRGNGRSAWHTQGGYEPIAEAVFGGLNVDTFLLEYDSERSGGFEPLRFIPQGKNVVLGLITTKTGALESQDALLRRIDEASKYVPLDRLALSPQCGFASVDAGNLLSWDEQKRKLELVAETARKVWG